jgi:hypothetical protein
VKRSERASMIDDTLYFFFFQKEGGSRRGFLLDSGDGLDESCNLFSDGIDWEFGRIWVLDQQQQIA